MVSELITVYGETDGSSTTGIFDLKSDIIHGSVDRIRIPRGMKLKIWAKRLSGKPLKLLIGFSKKGDFSDEVIIGQEVLSVEGEIAVEKRRPIVVRGMTGSEAVRFKWDQSDYGAGKSYVEIDVEFTDEE